MSGFLAEEEGLLQVERADVVFGVHQALRRQAGVLRDGLKPKSRWHEQDPTLLRRVAEQIVADLEASGIRFRRRRPGLLHQG